MQDRGQAAHGQFDPATVRIMPGHEVTHLHLLRHGEVVDLSERVVRGQMDVELSERGLEQGRRLAAWFAAFEQRPDVIHTSDLLRCSTLADGLAEQTSSTAIQDVRLREQDMGAWEGRTWKEITEAEPERVTAYWDDYVATRPTGGESLADLSERVLAWWVEIAPGLAGKRVVLVCHVGVIRVLLCHMLSVPLSEALRFAPATASHTSLLASDAGCVLETFGERPWSFSD